ncbi:hypothetical protein Hanom_Chr17g01588581 [Helianthus anomalus]
MKELRIDHVQKVCKKISNTKWEIGVPVSFHTFLLESSTIIPLRLLANQIAVSLGETLSLPKGLRTTASSCSLFCCSKSADNSSSPSSASARCLVDVISKISFTSGKPFFVSTSLLQGLS